jgi:hypothetical protein
MFVASWLQLLRCHHFETILSHNHIAIMIQVSFLPKLLVPNVLLVAMVSSAISSFGAANSNLQPNLHMGCLYSKNMTDKMRVCNSEDSPDAAGVYCHVPTVSYDEIRIAPGNWDSVSHGRGAVPKANSILSLVCYVLLYTCMPAVSHNNMASSNPSK